MPPKLRLNEELLTSKEVCFILGRSRTTLWRRKLEGAPFVDGRIGDATLAWWLERRDAARKLKMPVRVFLRLRRRDQERLLKKVAQKK